MWIGQKDATLNGVISPWWDKMMLKHWLDCLINTHVFRWLGDCDQALIEDKDCLHFHHLIYTILWWILINLGSKKT